MAHSFWSRSSATLALFLLAAALAWLVFGLVSGLVLLIVLLLGYCVQQLKQQVALARWLNNPRLETMPQGHGVWEDMFAALYRMARKQARSKQQLSAALERFRRAGEAMPDGVIILNENDRLEWFNSVAGAQFGLNVDTDVGRPVTYLLRQTQFNAYLEAHNYSEPFVLRSRADAILSLQLVPFGHKEKLLLSRDITRLERVETMRRDFIANVSHELRTPLTVVAGFVETLSDQAAIGDERRNYYLSLMQEQTDRMQRLVEDLLTLSKLESSVHPLQEETVFIAPLLHSVLAEAKALSDGKHTIELAIETDSRLRGNESELRSAFSNLLSNAVRYTPTGGTIAVSWKEADGEGVFSVRDSGIGIDRTHLPRLTERFYRVDRSRSRGTGGTGLGLSIVKHVLTRHQARLEISSEPGKGSTFTAIFPRARLEHDEDETEAHVA